MFAQRTVCISTTRTRSNISSTCILNYNIELLWFLGWLPPLLSRISESKTNVVVPIIDVIDDTTFEILAVPAFPPSTGGFDWGLQFIWRGAPQNGHVTPNRTHEPVRLVDKNIMSIVLSWIFNTG